MVPLQMGWVVSKIRGAAWSAIKAVAVSALPVFAMGMVAYIYAYQSITAMVTKNNMDRAEDAATDLERFMQERARDLAMLGSIPTLSDPGQVAANKDELLNRFSAAYQEFVVAFDIHGNPMARSGRVSLKERDDQIYAQRAANLHTVLVSLSENATSGAAIIHIAAPIVAPQSRVIGSVEADMPISQIDHLLSGEHTRDEKYFVTDKNGSIFLAAEKAYLHKQMNAAFPQLSRATSARKSEALVVESSITSKRILLAYSFTHGLENGPEINWGVAIGTDASIAYGSAHRLLLIVIIATVLSAFLAGGISVWTTRRATDPLLIDIERRKAVEKELASARDAAVALGRAKAEFLANMSHEIRTPLNSIVGFTGLLLGGELTAEQRDFMENIRASSDILLDTINNVLDFSKISAGKLEIEKINFDLRTVLESAVDLLAEAAQKEKLELALCIDEKVPPTVQGDPGRLRQVIVNLVNNAVKFTHVGEILVKVKAESETANDALVRFEVSDTGIGLSDEAQRGLFQPFYQADSSTTRKYGGTGLGLAIAAQLVELMSGTIGVKSQPGKGSTFWFTVPLTKAASSALPENARELAGVRVLIVDDNASNRQIVRRQMESWGMRVDLAADGIEALELMRSEASVNPYVIAVIDLQMPGMDGLELAAKIKAEPAISKTHLVMMSSAGDRREYGARVAGFEGWLTKPVKSSDLFRCLNSLPPHDGERPTMPASGVISGLSDGLQAGARPEQPIEPDGKASPAANARSKGHILLAEDNPINQKVALNQLKKLGYEVDVVANGHEVLTALTQIDYDAVLIDCQMPEMDGYEATKELRRREGDGRHTVVIAMTAYGLEGDREKCLEAGMDDYLAKPVRMGQLEKILGPWLAQKKQAQQADASVGTVRQT